MPSILDRQGRDLTLAEISPPGEGRGEGQHRPTPTPERHPSGSSNHRTAPLPPWRGSNHQTSHPRKTPKRKHAGEGQGPAPPHFRRPSNQAQSLPRPLEPARVRLLEPAPWQKTEPHRHAVPHGDRSGVPIEPLLTVQWYCNAAELAKPAIQAVETGATQFVPKQWENTFFAWMRDIQPWCISRQLWWGHRIPAWYGPDGEVFVATDDAEAAAHWPAPTTATPAP